MQPMESLLAQPSKLDLLRHCLVLLTGPKTVFIPYFGFLTEIFTKQVTIFSQFQLDAIRAGSITVMTAIAVASITVFVRLV